MKKKSLISFLCDYFNIGNISDSSQNGLQVDCGKDDIGKIAFAVDATLDSINEAAKQKADMLFVHHGLFWSHSLTIPGSHYNR
ncbi:MAG TPA: Nif3-like dinuclear metal center hexameric protein, partial [Spirochaetaceae bacterium]|nr:Nif3-like dinuclear metal center hexameric protein [Spirochaetaceae bacterium]